MVENTSTVPTVHELEQRHRALIERVATMTFDLGGLAYEMALRDHYRLDVLARRSGDLHRAEDELAEVERELAAARDGIAGQCPSCAATHSRGAVYCWSCGATLRPRGPVVLEAARS